MDHPFVDSLFFFYCSWISVVLLVLPLLLPRLGSKHVGLIVGLNNKCAYS